MIKDKHIPDLINKYSAYCPEGTTVIPGYISPNPGIYLLHVKFIPEKGEDLPEILILQGLAAVVENIRDLLFALTSHFIVHLLETREKKTSRVPAAAKFSVEEIARDIARGADMIFDDHQAYIMMGFSLGATSGAHSVTMIRNKPLRLIMIEPMATFDFPPLIRFLARYFFWLYYLIKPFLKLYMKKHRVDLKEDYELYVINCRILDSASPRKISAAVWAISSYNITKVLKAIDVPVVVIGASRDIFHSHNQAKMIAAGIRESVFIEMHNNKRTHSAEVSEWLLGHLRASSWK